MSLFDFVNLCSASMQTTPTSPEMVSVYLSLLTLLGLVVKMIYDLVTARQQRRWVIEDRKYKDDLALKTAAAVNHAELATRQIQASMLQRAQQMGEVLSAVEANTILTQASKTASETALAVANNHNAKIITATELATEALNKANETQRL